MVFEDNRLVPVLYGEKNAHLRTLEDAFDLGISSRGNELTITGDEKAAEKAREVLEHLWGRLQKGQTVDAQTVDTAIRFVRNEGPASGKNHGNASETIVTRKKRIDARTPVQAGYIRAMQTNDLTLGVGPAGTGKTYLAVAMAVSMLEAGKVERIILSRPAVEAGERIGFLPGELKDKMDPYMRPLYDALHDTMHGDKMQKRMATEEIEIAPLAFMRGRTLTNAFIILDEAQNATAMQMLMFLTRMGDGSRMVVTGDPSQTDLPASQTSGLREAMTILAGVESVGFANFTSGDVVRHPLVARIIKAYEAKSS